MAKNFDVRVKDKLYYSTGIASIVWIINNLFYKAIISMGAEGASASILFKVVGASTHIFFANFTLKHFQKVKRSV